MTFDGSPVNDSVLTQYIKQRDRGTEGFGFFDGEHFVKAAEEGRILRQLKKYRNQSDLLLFHHRWPTSTVNVKQAAHPFSTKDYFGDAQYVLIHNGGIWNDDDLFEKHQEMGIEYQSLLQDMTYNDSEALLWDFALTMEGRQDKLEAYGGIAFICMKLVNGVADKLYFGRNFSKPLNMLRDKHHFTLSSEGEGEEIKPATLYTYNYKLNRLTNKYFSIPASDPTVYRNYNYQGGYFGQNNTCGVNQNSGFRPDYDDEFDFTHANKFDRYDETATHYDDGVLWYDEEGEEHFEPFNTPKKDVPNSIPLLPTVSAMDPTDSEVTKAMFMYLEKSRGNYETAYWFMENDYENFELSPPSRNRTTQLLLIQATIDAMMKDPNWVDAKSTCELWQIQEMEEAE